MKRKLTNHNPRDWVHIAARAAFQKKPTISTQIRALGNWEFPESKQIVTAISMLFVLSVFTLFLTGFHYHQKIETERHLDRQDKFFNNQLKKYEKRIDSLHKQVKTRKIIESRMLAMMETYNSPLSQNERVAYASFLVDEARRLNIEPSTALSLVAVESGFDPRAKSHKGATGMTQLLPWVAKSIAEEAGVDWQGEQTLYDPYENTRLGLYYLNQLQDRFGDLQLALDAYNQGPSALSRKLSHGANPITGYSQKVLALADRFTKQTFI